MAAAQAKCDFVEFDVHMSSQKTFWAMHDPGMNRTTNIKEVFPDREMETYEMDDWPKKNLTDYFIVDFNDTEIEKMRLVTSDFSTSGYSTYIPHRNKIFDKKFKIPKLDDILDFCTRFNH